MIETKITRLKLLSGHDKISTVLCDLENPGLLQFIIIYSTSKLGKNKGRVEHKLLSRIFSFSNKKLIFSENFSASKFL